MVVRSQVRLVSTATLHTQHLTSGNRFKETERRTFTNGKNMKTLFKAILTTVFLCSTFAAQARWVSGYYRSNGSYVAPYYRGYPGYSGSSHDYVYRNPYAAFPSVHVSGYTRADGVAVLPYYRTSPNNTLTDNLSYRGFGTIRVPRYSPSW